MALCRLRRSSAPFLLVALCLSVAAPAAGQTLALGATAYASKTLREWSKDAFNEIERLRQTAISDSNDAVAQRITQADLAAQHLLAQAGKDIDRKIARVDVGIKESIDRIASLTVAFDGMIRDGADRFALQTDLTLSDVVLAARPPPAGSPA